jgi:GR25 family glycosyltransferase involved in LPS biosynthesis
MTKQESFEDSTTEPPPTQEPSTKPEAEINIFKEYPIDFYVITMGEEPRLQNIQKQIDKLNEWNHGGDKPVYIKHIDAVKGDELNLNKLVDLGKLKRSIIDDNTNGFTKPSRRKYEVGCYLSHIRTYNEIIHKNAPDHYSVIFEDDFDIQPNFMDVIKVVMKEIKDKKIDFDVLCLGMLYGKNADQLSENIYKVKCDVNCYGMHAYMIPNNKVDKILDKLSYIDNIIDVKLFNMSMNELTILRIEPNIVNQIGDDLASTIR